MTLSERRNYLIAIFASIGLHLLLVFIYLPQQLLTKPVTYETFAVGMIEMPAGIDTPVKTQQIISIAPKQPLGTRKPLKTKKVESPVPTLAPAKVKSDPKPAPEKKVLAAATESTISSEKKPVEPVATTVPVIAKNTPDKPVVTQPPATPIPTSNAESIAKTNTGNEKTAANSISASSGNSTGDGKTAAGELNGSNEAKIIALGTGETLITSRGGKIYNPKGSENEGRSGDVAVHILVFAKGVCENVILTKSSGDIRMDNLVLNWVRNQWKFITLSPPQNYYIDLIVAFRPKADPIPKFIKAETRP